MSFHKLQLDVSRVESSSIRRRRRRRLHRACAPPFWAGAARRRLISRRNNNRNTNNDEETKKRRNDRPTDSTDSTDRPTDRLDASPRPPPPRNRRLPSIYKRKKRHHTINHTRAPSNRDHARMPWMRRALDVGVERSTLDEPPHDVRHVHRRRAHNSRRPPPRSREARPPRVAPPRVTPARRRRRANPRGRRRRALEREHRARPFASTARCRTRSTSSASTRRKKFMFHDAARRRARLAIAWRSWRVRPMSPREASSRCKRGRVPRAPRST